MATPDVIQIKIPKKLVETRVLNGLWSATLETELDDYLENECYIEIYNPDTEEDELWIVRDGDWIKSKGDKYIGAKIEHLMTELNDFTVEAFEHENLTATQFLTAALTGSTWSAGTVADLGTETVTSDRRITCLEAVSLGVKKFGGELYFNQDRTVDWKTTIGQSRGVQIRYDKNSDYIKRRVNSKGLVTRLYPYGQDNITINTQIMEACDKTADWVTSDEDNFKHTPDSDIKKQGSSSIYIYAKATGSLNDTIIRDFGAGSELDLTDHDLIKFWIRASRTGTNLQIGMGEAAWDDNTHNINIITADRWQEEEWDISGIANADKNAIRYLGLKCTNAGALNEIYLDYIRAFDGEIYLESAHLGDYLNPKELPLFTTFASPAELKAYAQDYLDLYDTSVVSYQANVVDLSTLPQWSNEKITLGDTVRVYDGELKLNVDCRVLKIVRDRLNAKNLKLDLTNSIQNIAHATAQYYQQLGYSMPFHDDDRVVNAGSVRIGYLVTSVLRAGHLFATHYNQLRNVLPFNFDDSLDATYPLECEFYIPPNVDEIKSAWIHIVGRNFRAYSKGAASGGGHTTPAGGGHTTAAGGGSTSGSGGGQTSSSGGGQTTSSGGYHQHNVTGVCDVSNGYHRHTNALITGFDSGSTGKTGIGDNSFEAHIHKYNRRDSVTGYVTIGASFDVYSGYTAAHDHTVSNHTHTVSDHTHTTPNHQHSVSDHTHTVSNHTHNLVFGIYESTDPTGVNIYVDDGDGYGGSLASDDSPVSINYNIASEITTAEGRKKLKITSSRLGRVVVEIFLDLTLSSR